MELKWWLKWLKTELRDHRTFYCLLIVLWESIHIYNLNCKESWKFKQSKTWVKADGLLLWVGLSLGSSLVVGSHYAPGLDKIFSISIQRQRNLNRSICKLSTNVSSVYPSNTLMPHESHPLIHHSSEPRVHFTCTPFLIPIAPGPPFPLSFLLCPLFCIPSFFLIYFLSLACVA